MPGHFVESAFSESRSAQAVPWKSESEQYARRETSTPTSLSLSMWRHTLLKTPPVLCRATGKYTLLYSIRESKWCCCLQCIYSSSILPTSLWSPTTGLCFMLLKPQYLPHHSTCCSQIPFTTRCFYGNFRQQMTFRGRVSNNLCIWAFGTPHLVLIS